MPNFLGRPIDRNTKTPVSLQRRNVSQRRPSPREADARPDRRQGISGLVRRCRRAVDRARGPLARPILTPSIVVSGVVLAAFLTIYTVYAYISLAPYLPSGVFAITPVMVWPLLFDAIIFASYLSVTLALATCYMKTSLGRVFVRDYREYLYHKSRAGQTL
jgi:hypothetical protein